MGFLGSHVMDCVKRFTFFFAFGESFETERGRVEAFPEVQ